MSRLSGVPPVRTRYDTGPKHSRAYAPSVAAGSATSSGLRVTASAGFYVRSLAHDLGQRLGPGAHLTALRREQSGLLGLRDAHRLPTALVLW